MVGEILNQRTAPNRELLTTTNFWRPLQNSLVLQVLLYSATFSGLIISYGWPRSGSWCVALAHFERDYDRDKKISGYFALILWVLLE